MKTCWDISRERIRLAKKALRDSMLDAMVFFDSDMYGRKFANTSAFTALIIFAEKPPVLIAHSIEKDHAESECRIEVMEIKDSRDLKFSLKEVFSERSESRKAKIAIVPWNAKFEKVKVLQELDYEIVDANDVLQKCLKKPFPEELEMIRKLSQVCDRGLDVASKVVEVGKREYEVAAEVDYVVKRLGATEFDFPTIIASGYRAAFPHGWTSSKEIAKGDVVVVDIGPVLNGYGGCVCRTFPTSGGWEKEIEVIREAISKSLEVIESEENPLAVQIDKVARETVRKNGYESWPNMSTVWTGHPIGGFSCPVITPYSEDIIEEDMVFTVEPGIYIKGKGGVRIEHHVLARKYGYEILDNFPEI